jgi:hypothetical protein
LCLLRGEATVNSLAWWGADDVDAAFHHITNKLLEWEAAEAIESAKAARSAMLKAHNAFTSAHRLALRVTEEAELGGASPGLIAQTPTPLAAVERLSLHSEHEDTPTASFLNAPAHIRA